MRYLITFFALLCIYTPANASMTVCNDTEETILIAVARQHGFQIFSRTWDVIGWYKLDGDCAQFSGGELVAQRAYVAVFRKRNDSWESLTRDKISINQVKQSFFSHPKAELLSGVSGEDDFCVRDDSINIQGKKWNEISSCASNWFKVTPLFYINHPSNIYYAEVSIRRNDVRMRSR